LAYNGGPVGKAPVVTCDAVSVRLEVARGDGGLVPRPEGVVAPAYQRERVFFIDKLLVRIHFIIVMIGWTGLAPWELNFPGDA